MEFILKCRVQDAEGKPLNGIQVSAYDKDFPLPEHMLASAKSDEKGEVEIRFIDSRFRHLFTREPHIFFEIMDIDKSFQFVRDSLGDYSKKINNNELLWRSGTIGNIADIDNYTVTVVKEPKGVPEQYQAVVIGSGFGGTITSLTLANFFSKNNSSGNNNGLEIKIPAYNVYPGHSQTQNIVIISDKAEDIIISNIGFDPQPPQGLSLKIHDPSDVGKNIRYPLTIKLSPNVQQTIPLTVTLEASRKPVSLDIHVRIPMTRNQTQKPKQIDSKITLHIGPERVCVLERGQWWISHEMPSNKDGTTDGNPTIRQYLEENNIRYSICAYPDNLKGLLALFGNTREINRIRGLYDYKIMQNVHAVTASGVGGGSLVYFNITEGPDAIVYQKWSTQSSDKPLDKKYTYKDIYGVDAISYVDTPADVDNIQKGIGYFEIASNFIGTNNITTTTGPGKFKLPRSRAFQDAAQRIQNATDSILNEEKIAPDGTAIRNFDVNLSITDIPSGLFAPQNGTIQHPTISQVNKFSRQINSCQRQGRCGLGCIPGARHTLNKQLHGAISAGKPLDVFPLCQVDTIEDTGNSGFKYRINFKDYRDDNRGIPRKLETNLVVLAAGTLGSTEILSRSKNHKKLLISDTLGTHFSNNGDTFGVIHPTKENVDSSRGPMQTSIAKFKNNKTGEFYFSIEDLGIPKMFGEILPMIFKVMAFQKEVGNFLPNQNLGNMITKVVMDRIRDQNTRDDLLKLVRSFDISMSGIATDRIVRIINDINESFLDDKTRIQSPEERTRNVMMLFGVGRDNPNSQLFLDDNDQINLNQKYHLDKDSQPVVYDIIDRMQDFAKEIGKNREDSLFIPFWSQENKEDQIQITAHPLGGCHMGNDASSGVLDSFGNVFEGNSGDRKYEGLYVVDGSTIPSSLGVNPSLTISALAFRSAEHLVSALSGGKDAKEFWPR